MSLLGRRHSDDEMTSKKAPTPSLSIPALRRGSGSTTLNANGNNGSNLNEGLVSGRSFSDDSTLQPEDQQVYPTSRSFSDTLSSQKEMMMNSFPSTPPNSFTSPIMWTSLYVEKISPLTGIEQELAKSPPSLNRLPNPVSCTPRTFSVFSSFPEVRNSSKVGTNQVLSQQKLNPDPMSQKILSGQLNDF